LKTLIILISILFVSGCAANGERENNNTAWIIAGAIVVGAVIASGGGSDSPAARDCYIVVTATGSSQVCD